MTESVSGDVVPAPCELTDTVGMIAGSHPENEEGRLRIKRVEEVEHTAELALECVPGTVPVWVAESPGEKLVAVLEVEAQKQGPPRHEVTMNMTKARTPPLGPLAATRDLLVGPFPGGAE